MAYTKKSSNNSLFKGVIFLLASAFAYGTNGILYRFIGQYFQAFTQNWLKYLILISIYLFILLTHKKYWKKLNFKEALALFGWGVIGSTTTVMSFIAFNHLAIGTTYFLTYASMVASGIIFGYFLYKDKLSVNKIIGLILILVGLILIYSFSIDSKQINYMFLILLAGGLIGLWNVLSKKFSNRYSTFQMLFFDALPNILVGLSGAMFFHETVPNLIHTPAIFPLLGFVIATLLATNFMVLGFKYVDSQTGSMILPMEIVFGASFGFLVFGEVLSVTTLLGGFCILLATIIVTLGQKAKQT